MFKKITGILILFLLLTCISGYFYLKHTYKSISPLTATTYYMQSIITPHANLSKHVLGFLPYWQVDQIPNIRPQLLSEINYFSLSVGPDGHILKETNGETEPGWMHWQSAQVKSFMDKAHILGAKNTVTVAALENDLIEAILNDKNRQQNLIGDITHEVTSRNLDGVTIDFEYLGEPDTQYKTAFIHFSHELQMKLKNVNPDAKLSLTLLPLAVRTKGLFDLPKLRAHYDYFIGMSYEYYGKNAEIAGPTAPMQGFAQNKYFFDIQTTYADFLKELPKDKIIMGVPYYGWERSVKDGKTPGSRTYAQNSPNNYAAVISYARAKDDPDLIKNQCFLDTLAAETWCWFTDKTTGIDHQVWIADTKSIETRYAYAKKQQLAGVAIWTLGYDKTYEDLWNLLSRSFAN